MNGSTPAIHREVREMVARHGGYLVSDPAEFRAALEDLLGDERDLPPGLVNLLVDAVGHQVTGHVAHLVDNGADPVTAVRTAATRFAEVRGGGDPGRCAWAVAVLGHAVGRVPEDLVLRTYLAAQWSGGGPPPPERRTVPPPPPPRLPPGDPTRPAPVPLPPAPVPARRRRGRVALVVGLVATVLVVATGAGLAWWALDDDPRPQRSASEEADGPADPTDLEGVADRYANLAADVTTGVTSCEPVDDAPAGVTERLRCSLPAATLELTTFETTDDLAAARAPVFHTETGTISDVSDDRAYFGFDPANGGSADPAEIYWDLAAARQSGHLVAAPDVPYEELSADFAESGPVVAEPTEPAHPRLIRLLAGLGIGGCERIPTFGDGETEENRCALGQYDVYAAAFGTEAELLRYRVATRGWQREDRVYTGSSVYCHQVDADPVCLSAEGERVLGRILGYVSEDGQEDESGVLYLDHVRCGCYVEVWGREGVGRGDPNALLPVLFP